MIAAPVLYLADSALEDPRSVIAEAQQLRYGPLPRNPSVRVSRPSLRSAQLCAEVEKRIGARVRWHPGSGNFRVTTLAQASATGSHTHVHADYGQDVIALFYLTPPEDCHGGTGFYRHRETALLGLHDLPELRAAARRHGLTPAELGQLLEREARDPTRWELIERVEMKFNRLLVFDGTRFHSHVLDFASVRPGSVRLTVGCWGARQGEVSS